MDAYLKCADRMAELGQSAEAIATYQQFMIPDAVRSAALAGLIYAQPNKAGSRLLDALNGGDATIKSTAIGIIGRMENIQNLKEIAAVFPRLKSMHQIQLIYALAERGDRSVTEDITALTQSPILEVRVSAIEALGILGDASTVDLLAGFAVKDGAEKDAARDALGRIHGQGVDKAMVTKLKTAEDPVVQVELLSSIGKRYMKNAVPAVMEKTKSDDRKVRTEAIKTLGQIASPDHLTDMVNILIEAKTASERREAEKSVVSVSKIIENKDKQAQAVLAAYPSVKKADIQGSMLEVMGRIGDDNALPVIRDAISKKNLDLKKAGVRALSSWPTAEPIDDLLSHAESSKDNALQILSVRGYIRMIGLDTETSADDKPILYKKAFDLCSEMNEKSMVLSGLSETHSLSSLKMAASFLKGPSLVDESEVAVVTIANRIWSEHGEEVRPVMERIVEQTKNEDLKERAQRIIDRIDDAE
jgi:HEAT repeat protein